MKRGSVERQEFNYIRHGTQCLIATLHLGTGQLIEPTVQDTRTEVDFAAQIDCLIQTDPQAPWIILCDQLNTHKSKSLVKYVAAAIGDEQDLGIKGKTGILKNMASRMAYLENPDHRIRFTYTPKHCSWLNSIEVWFSILTTHVLKRGNFISIKDLKQKIERYISYYNQHLAKAWNWSVVKSKDIKTLIDKVKQIERAFTKEMKALC
jgi:transposase